MRVFIDLLSAQVKLNAVKKVECCFLKQIEDDAKDTAKAKQSIFLESSNIILKGKVLAKFSKNSLFKD